MKFTPKLKKATLVKRYKRFLADVILEDQSETTIHCANTGAMTGCATPDDIVWYSTSDNLKRKYPFSWEITQTAQNDLICVNTIRANQLVEEAIKENTVVELSGYKTLSREVKYGNENSKVDFLLTFEHQVDAFVEVKSVTLLEDNKGFFPDAVTIRGQKHLRELIEIVEQGNQAYLLFAVLHSGIYSVQAASHIDSKYAELLSLAISKGVKVIAYKAKFDELDGDISIKLSHQIPVFA